MSIRYLYIQATGLVKEKRKQMTHTPAAVVALGFSILEDNNCIQTLTRHS